MRQVTDAGSTAARQIKQITASNREHTSVVTSLARQLAEIREITDRNAHGVQATHGGTEDLLQRAEALLSITRGRGTRAARSGKPANGNGRV